MGLFAQVHAPKAPVVGTRSAALAALRSLRAVPRMDPMRRGGAVSTLLRTGGAPGPRSPFGAPRPPAGGVPALLRGIRP